MALVPLIEYADDWIDNFWKALANDPRELARVWQNVKQMMAPGALDPLVKGIVDPQFTSKASSRRY